MNYAFLYWKMILILSIHAIKMNFGYCEIIVNKTKSVKKDLFLHSLNETRNNWQL